MKSVRYWDMTASLGELCKNFQNGYTSLHWACQKGHVEIVRILVLAGARLEAVDKVLKNFLL